MVRAELENRYHIIEMSAIISFLKMKATLEATLTTELDN